MERCMCGTCQQKLFLYSCIMFNFTWFSTTLPTKNDHDQGLTIFLNLAVKLIGPTSPGPLYLKSVVSQLRFMLIFLMSELFHLKPISMYSLLMSKILASSRKNLRKKIVWQRESGVLGPNYSWFRKWSELGAAAEQGEGPSVLTKIRSSEWNNKSDQK